MIRRLGFLLRRQLLWAVPSIAALAVSQGCDGGQEACRRSRTCVSVEGPSLGASGLGGSSGGGLLTGGPTGGWAGGWAGSGAEGGLGGAGPVHAVGDACTTEGEYACAGHAQRVQLICEQGAFVEYGICRAKERCDTRPDTLGLCQPIVTECVGQHAADVICRGDERLVCGEDLITTESLGMCSGGCLDGQCTECRPDAEATCEFNSVRTCSAAGTWVLTPCDAETPVCTNGACGQPPSCLDLPETCGQSEACCTSPLVTGGEFFRDNDATQKATIKSFRLDRFEVTVGRFRKFKAAWDAGWRPDNGSGKHVHLNDGQGLVDLAVAKSFEAGWRNEYLAYTNPSDTNLTTFSGDVDPYATWTSTPQSNETRPQNLVTRHEAYAFCIWDGAFLPSDAEWSYAARGGDEQRPYPWGNGPPQANLAIHGCQFGPGGGTCTDYRNIAPVGHTNGVGLFGQLDLLGNVSEWTLGSTSKTPCTDCTDVSLGDAGNVFGHPCRGRAFPETAAELSDHMCFDSPHTNSYRVRLVGIRCARSP